MVEEIKKTDIDTTDMSQSGNENESPKDTNDADKSVTESRACSDIHKDLADLTSQVQMMSDSLAACKQMSKYRPLRKAYDVAVRTKSQLKPQASGQACLPQEKRPQKDMIISYMTTRNKSHTNLRWNGDVSLDSFTDDSDWSDCATHKRRLETEDIWKIPKGTSRPKVYKAGDVDPARMAFAIERELKTLVRLSPSVTVLADALSGNILRYTACHKCSKRISSSLPWILSRIQELIVYAASKTKKTPPTACSSRFGSTAEEEETTTEVKLQEKYEEKPKEKPIEKSETEKPAKERGISFKLPPGEDQTEIAYLETVDATAATDARPGIQILLEVKPEKLKKRFCQKVGYCDLRARGLRHVQVRLNEVSTQPVVQVLKPSPQPKVCNQEKQGILYLKGQSKSFLQLSAWVKFSFSFLVFTPVGKVHPVEKSRKAVFPKPALHLEQRLFKRNLSYAAVFTRKKRKSPSPPPPKEVEHKSYNRLEEKPSRWDPIIQSKTSLISNDRKSVGIQEFLANAPVLVRDLLREAEEENMEVGKLEMEIQSLKDLMLEVHRNQIQLSRFFLDNGIYSQSLIKLSNPNMLAGEGAALKKIEDSLMNSTYSVESVKKGIFELKERCNLKNRLLLALIKGLESDVPKEWWEEVLTSTLEDSKAIEKLDNNKLNDLIWRISLLPTNSEKASKATSRFEEQSSEEEPNAKGNVGANVNHDLISLSFLDGNVVKTSRRTSDFDNFLDCQSPLRVLAVPTTPVQKDVNGSIKKLETQITVLNSENEKLWREVHELKDLLDKSVKELNEKRLSSHALKGPLLDKHQRTINLTIQIATEKPLAGSSRNSEFATRIPQDVFVGEGSDSRSMVRYANPEISSDIRKIEQSVADRRLALLATKPKFLLKSNRRRSQNDLNFVDDLSPTPSKSGEETQHKLGILQENEVFDHQVMVATPHPSGHVLRLLKPNIDCYQAGPSNKQTDYRFQPSDSPTDLTDEQQQGAYQKMSNDRQLMPIMENENLDTCSSSGSISQTIQQLRMKVRSIHKEVTMLKLKNDRIDKLLDKLLEDAAYNTESLEEMENNINDFNSRLG